MTILSALLVPLVVRHVAEPRVGRKSQNSVDGTYEKHKNVEQLFTVSSLS